MMPVLLAALLLATPQIAVGQAEDVKKALAGCAALDIEAARLDCFEQLAHAVAQMLPSPLRLLLRLQHRSSRDQRLPVSGRWKLSTSPVDDSKTVALGLVDGTDSMQLVLLCQQGKPRAYVTPAKYLGADPTPVLTRLGEAKAETRRWRVSLIMKPPFIPETQAHSLRNCSRLSV